MTDLISREAVRQMIRDYDVSHDRNPVMGERIKADLVARVFFIPAAQPAVPQEVAEVMAKVDRIMDGYDWVGTGDSESADLEYEEWLSVRSKLGSILTAQAAALAAAQAGVARLTGLLELRGSGLDDAIDALRALSEGKG